MKTILPILVSIILLAYALSITHKLFIPFEFEFVEYLFRSIILMASLALFLFGIIKIKIKKFANSLVLIGTCYLLFIILEISFSFIAISTGENTSLMAKNWFNFYWQENELGYRDLPPQTIDRADVKNIFLIGDSYIAGSGITNESNRISNILRNKYADCFDVFNIARCGANTKEQLQFLESFPIKPDLIIVTHLRNDIDGAVGPNETDHIVGQYRENLIKLPVKYNQSNSYLVKNSFFINYVDFNLFINRRTRKFSEIISAQGFLELITKTTLGADLLLKHYEIDTFFSAHLLDLKKFKTFSNDHNSNILFILFPDSHDDLINYTNEIVNEPLMKFFEANEIEALNLTPTLKSMDFKKRVVNKYDFHPSTDLNMQIALVLESEIQDRFGMQCH